MDSNAYPPASALKAVKKIRIVVVLQGQPPALIEKVIKQVVGGIIGTGSDAFAVDYLGDDSSAALLQCTVAATPSMTDDNDRPLGMAYLVRGDLFTTLASHPDDELFNIWSDCAFGHTDSASLYTTLMDWAKNSAYKLVERLERSRG